jgi:cytochrome c-type biogenesis protein
LSGAGIGYLAAFGGGIVSFASPCVLPIVPACLSVVTGIDIAAVEGDGGKGRSSVQLARVARDTALFVAGFGVVFVLIGLTATAVGQALLRDRLTLTKISGGVLVAMAAFLLVTAAGRVPVLQRELRFHPSASKLGPYAAPVAGAAFGFGWTPCLGPVLASVLAVAASTGSLSRSVLLLVCYSLGLGVPFLAVGVAFGRAAVALSLVRRHLVAITVVSAVAIGAFGVLLLFDRWSLVTIEFERLLRAVGLGRLINLG